MFPESENFTQEEYFDEKFLQKFFKDQILKMGKEDLLYYDLVLKSNKYGTRFMHAEAYEVCSLGIFWPDFMRDSNRSGYVLGFAVLNSEENNYLRYQFEEWFDLNRSEIADYAAQALGREIESF